MNSLELSYQVQLAFESLRTLFPNSKLIESNLELRLECEHIAIGVVQTERYEKGVNCYLELKEEHVSFSFFDLAYAIQGDTTFHSSEKKKSDSIKGENDRDVQAIVQFCIENEQSLTEWPPSWFQKASSHSIEKLAEHFPSLAESTRLELQNIFQKWQQCRHRL